MFIAFIECKMNVVIAKGLIILLSESLIRHSLFEMTTY